MEVLKTGFANNAGLTLSNSLTWSDQTKDIIIRKTNIYPAGTLFTK
jgi:hypothetical protein